MSQSKPQLKLDWCSHDAAKYAVEHWHYSKTMPKSKLVKVGVWEDGQFVGVLIFGVSATADLVKRYGLGATEGCELVRVALTSHRTSVSRIVSISLKMLKRLNPGLRLVVSFADPEHGHVGGIYQAGGWIYAGNSQASDEYIVNGKRLQGRAFRHKYKGYEHHPSVKIVKGSPKYRYLMPLDDEMKQRVLALSQPYPKKPCAVSIEGDALSVPTERGRVNTITALQDDQATLLERVEEVAHA